MRGASRAAYPRRQQQLGSLVQRQSVESCAVLENGGARVPPADDATQSYRCRKGPYGFGRNPYLTISWLKTYLSHMISAKELQSFRKAVTADLGIDIACATSTELHAWLCYYCEVIVLYFDFSKNCTTLLLPRDWSGQCDVARLAV